MTPLVLITGASSGIGQAMALHYLQQGARLALVARRSEAMQSWLDALAIPPANYAIYCADVADAQQMASVAAQRSHAKLA